MTAPDTPIVPRFRLLRVLGEGGMGLVYEAEQLAPVRRRVAVKVLKAGMDTKAFVGRFEAERQALAVMDHPGIARVYEAGATAEGRPYYAMEYVAGVPLSQFADEQRLSTRARIELMIGVCGAVHHAHQKGIIHRDLKPSNVLVGLQEDRPVSKIIDFGIAKALTGRLADSTFITDFGQPIGTPAYMSPEQWESGQLDIDTRTDVYSLGVILFELLVGALPYDAGSLVRAGPAAPVLLRETQPPTPSTKFQSLAGAALLARARRTDPSSLARELRGDLDWIALKALESDRTRRYETVHGLALDLGRYLRSEPVTARPPSTGYRISRFVQRHRVGTAVAAALVMTAAAFTGLTLVQANRVARERDRAELAAARAGALNDFLQRTLLSPDPIDGLGRDATMLQALDSAASRLRTEPVSQPAVDAAVRSAIGWAYFKLGSYDRAGPLLLGALATRRALGDTEPGDLAESLLRAAALYEIRSVPDSAERLYREAIAIRQAVLGADDPRIAEALTRSGAFLGRQGDSIAGREALREAEAVYGHLGDSAGIAIVNSHLGELEYTAENFAEAERRFAAALAWRRAHLGDHPLLAEALSNVGAVLEDLNRLDESEAHYREALRIAERTLGPDHDQVTAIGNNLALLLGRRGRVSEADSLYRRILAVDERSLGPDHPAVGIDLFNLADLLCRSGDPAAGAAIASRAVRVLTKGGAPLAWQAAMSQVVLGRCLTRARRYREAEAQLLAGLKTLEETLGPSHRRADTARARLKQLYQEWKGRN